MASEFYVLSRDDMLALRQTMERVRRQSANSRNRAEDGDDTIPAPEVYLARVPASGIPGPSAVGTAVPPASEAPNSAACTLWRLSLITGQLESLSGFTRVVYSLVGFVPGNSWILAERDKFGTWWAVAAFGQDSQTSAAFVEATSWTYQSVALNTSLGGGSIDAYPAQSLTLVNGQWTPKAAGWFYGINGEVPIKGGYLCWVSGYDTSTPPKPVWSTDIPALTVFLEISSLETVDIPLAGSNPGETATVYPALLWYYSGFGTGSWSSQPGAAWYLPINRETPALGTRYFCRFTAVDASGTVVWGCGIPLGGGSGGNSIELLDKTGAVVDSACQQLKADPNGYQTWLHLATNEDQLIVNPAAIVGSPITVTNNFNWTLDKYWTINSGGGGGGIGINVPLEICGYQFWCCTTYAFSGSPTTPSTPVLGSIAGGTLPGNTYYVKITYVDNGSEGNPSSEAQLTVSANHLLTVASPSSGPSITGWNVYVGTTPGGETRQNTTPIAIGVNWTEPLTGLRAGPSIPVSFPSINDWTLPPVGTPDQGKTVYEVLGSGSVTLTGIAPANWSGAAGPQIIEIVNAGTGNVAIPNQSGSSETNHQIVLPPAYLPTLVLEPNDAITLWYDTCVSNVWRVLACTVDVDPTLLTKNQDNSDSVAATSTIIANNDQGTKAFGRIHFTASGTTNALDWQGLRLYMDGTGYVGAEPDIRFVAGAGISIAVSDDPANKWVNATIACTLSPLQTINLDNTDNVAATAKIVANNDQGTKAFGRIHFDSSGTTNELNWQGQLVYIAGTGYVGPEPDIEFLNSSSVTWSATDSPTNKRVQVQATVVFPPPPSPSLTVLNAVLANTVTFTVQTTLLSLNLTAAGTYLLTADVSATAGTTTGAGTLQINAWLQNGASFIAGSGMSVVFQTQVQTGIEIGGSASCTIPLVVTGSATIDLVIVPLDSTPGATHEANGDNIANNDPTCRLTALKIA